MPNSIVAGGFHVMTGFCLTLTIPVGPVVVTRPALSVATNWYWTHLPPGTVSLPPDSVTLLQVASKVPQEPPESDASLRCTWFERIPDCGSVAFVTDTGTVPVRLLL